MPIAFTYDGKKLRSAELPHSSTSTSPRGSTRYIRDFNFTWDNIPDFAILTGKNGSGKSYILELMASQIKKERNSLHIGADFIEQFNTYSGMNGVKIEQEYLEELAGFIYQCTEDTSFSIDSVDRSSSAYARNKSYTELKHYKLLIKSCARNVANQAGYRDKSEQEKKSIIAVEVNKPNFISDSSIIDYNIKTIINSSIESINSYKVRLKEKYSNFPGILQKPYQLWKENLMTEGQSFEDFITYTADRKRLDPLIDQVINMECLSFDALERFNQLLPHSFPYKLIMDQGSIFCYPRKMDATSVDRQYRVELEHLSSGEQMLLKIVSMTFYNIGLGTNKEGRFLVTKPDIILFDEPDRHLDPRLTKIFLDFLCNVLVKQEGIQVIMVTHRIDTIALVPDTMLDQTNKTAGIFAIQDGKNALASTNASSGASAGAGITSIDHNLIDTQTKKVTRITKMHAMYKLTQNFREFSGHHFPVYCESTDDADFYNSAYGSLMTMCEAIPHSSSKIPGPYFYYDIDRTNHTSRILYDEDGNSVDRLLSRRYQFKFQTVTLAERLEGGCSQVYAMVQRQCNPYLTSMGDVRDIRKRGSKFSGQFYMPYGLIDNDGTDNLHVRVAEEISTTAKDRVLKPRKRYITTDTSSENPSLRLYKGGRHSIENFVFDPFIICSLFTKDEIASMLNLRGGEEEIKNRFLVACTYIKSRIGSKAIDIKKLQENINIYFFDLFQIYKIRFILPDECQELTRIQILSQQLKTETDKSKKNKIGTQIGEEREKYKVEFMNVCDYLMKVILADDVRKSDILCRASDDIVRLLSIDRDSKEDAVRIINHLLEQISPQALKDNINYNSPAQVRTVINKVLARPEYSSLTPIISEVLDNAHIKETSDKSMHYYSSQYTQRALCDEVARLIEEEIIDTFQPVDLIYSDGTGITKLQVNYSKTYLNIRGHNLEKCFKSGTKERIIESTCREELACIPLDLAQIFFDLSKKVREHMKEVVKPWPVPSSPPSQTQPVTGSTRPSIIMQGVSIAAGAAGSLPVTQPVSNSTPYAHKGSDAPDRQSSTQHSRH